MRLNLKPERNAAGWFWRFLLGPAQAADAIASTLTIGTLSIGASLFVARKLTVTRLPLEAE